MRIVWEVFGDPKPQPRPRVFRNGGVKSEHSPWAKDVEFSALEMVRRPYKGALFVELDFRLPRPKAMKRDASLVHIHTTDCDNLGKAVLDSLQRAGLYVNDAQIDRLSVRKRYARPDEKPGCRIVVTGEDE